MFLFRICNIVLTYTLMGERRVTNIKLIFGFFVALYVSISFTFGADTISPNQIIRYNDTIVSPQETFELGFFSPGNSMNHYVGIWYKKRSYRTVVWVANGDAPLTHTSGELTLTLQGVLAIRDTTTGNVLWSSTNSSSTTSVRNPISQLLDMGNFIIYEEGGDINQENHIWQSFDFLTGTFLPGMKLGMNLVTGFERRFKSWKSDDDPATGNFSYWIDTRGYPQAILTDGPDIKFRAGSWNGLRSTGIPNLRPNPIYNYTFVINQKEIYYQYDLINTSYLMRVVLHPNGRLERLLWTEDKQQWALYLAPESNQCDWYNVCGPFGRCSIENSPVCECLKGFEPTSPDLSQGCRRTIPLDCGPGDGFIKYSNLKLPDTRWSWYNQTMTLVECEKMCKSNFSCTAYTNSNISGPGSGCLLWFGDLIDIRTFAENGDTLYVRMPASELDRNISSATENRKSSSGRIRLLVVVMVPITFVILVILLSRCLLYCLKRKKQHQRGTPKNKFGHDPENRSDDEDLELQSFSWSTLLKVTNNFSTNNKLGEGGFGPVYKGVLEDGKEIAVKRLAKTSSQGLHEFKNEVISISKLQHRNLVKLLGYCIEGAEKMLVYEYMPNKSLDSFIFDRTQSVLLNWPARYNIIIGISRGLSYIHRDSRLRIIHRDLKVSNILLDKDMNPKISDFGMARSFGGNQIEANTNRVVGTYGYMAPEYAGDGVFSIKSDVYSFGVVVLEIICGERNRGFVHKEHYNNLMGHAWRVHNEGRSLELVAKCLGKSINASEVLRSIHVGLLCVQRLPEDRPTMTSVLLMLGSEGSLPSPKEPGFYVGECFPDTAHSHGISSNNELSISMLNGR